MAALAKMEAAVGMLERLDVETEVSEADIELGLERKEGRPLFLSEGHSESW
jgi:hypothetical protein